MQYAFLVRISNCAVKRKGESARWADLTIRLVVEANGMSARRQGILNVYKQDVFQKSPEYIFMDQTKSAQRIL